MAPEDVGVAADSPTAGPVEAQQPSAETLTTDAEPRSPQTIPYDRFKEVNDGYRSAVAQNAALQQQLQHAATLIQQLQNASQRASQQGSTEEARQYQMAGDALLKILEQHPQLRPLLQMTQALPQLMQGYQGVQQLQERHQQVYLSQGRSQIASLASESGLPTDDEALNHFEELVAGVIRRTPGAEERFKNGDLSVVGDAFQKVSQGLLAQLRRESAASLKTTKDQTKRLPPAPRGGIPGGSAPPKLEPGKEREYEQGLHQRATDVLLERLRGG